MSYNEQGADEAREMAEKARAKALADNRYLLDSLAAAEKVIAAARELAEEARPHTDFAKLWKARDKTWAALAEFDALKGDK